MSTSILGGDLTTNNITINSSGTAPTVQSSDNSTNIATTAFVKSNLSSQQIPTGIIVMWSGSSSNIPIGWSLCNGQNGTPNLQGRFIIGSSGSYTVGQMGGSSTVSLTVQEIPAHSHQMQGAGNHAHQFQSSYYQNQNGELQEFYNGHENENYNEGTVGGPFSIAQSDWRGPQGTLNMVGAGDHIHTIQNTGGSGQHENMPPYYVLAYIMKT